MSMIDLPSSTFNSPRFRPSFLNCRLGLCGLILCGFGGEAPQLIGADTMPTGYYRFPTIHADTVVFTAEGDLWRVASQGGTAQRLTTHPGIEHHPTLSLDGKILAFAAEYEGPTEVYTMPLSGGLPTRRTFTDSATEPTGWTPDGKLMYSTWRYWELPDQQIATLDLATDVHADIPLAMASRGVFDDSGESLYFTRTPFNRGSVKRYKGGTVENLWKFTRGEPEAKPLTVSYTGPSRWPMWWKGRVYHVTDRDAP